jgi:hypothetical protein
MKNRDLTMVKIGLEVFKSKAGGALIRRESLSDNFVSFILGFKEMGHLNVLSLSSAKIQKERR